MLFLFGALFACNGGSTTQYTGHTTYKYMPLDGERSWRYGNDGMNFELLVEKVDAQLIDGVEIVSVEYSKYDPQELLATIDWSSDSIFGIQIHGYTLTNQGGMDFETPVLFADYRMIPGENVVSTTDGITFTSTFNGVEMCPNNWVSEENAWECLYFTVESDSASGTFPFVGDWWIANTWGASRFITPQGTFGSENTWVLSQADY
ncbi:MAG: hypothetical protein VX278_02815 [Myxococcota bacterium]|nr:hypothetical protein [Myxococcota bacterium]